MLWPIRGRVPLEPPDGGTGINNVSVVLLGRVGRRRFLLTGDVEEDIDPSLLAEGLPQRGPAQGGAPRQPDGDDPAVRRRGPAAGRGRVGRAPATRTATRPRPRSSGWPRRAPASFAPTSTGRWRQVAAGRHDLPNGGHETAGIGWTTGAAPPGSPEPRAPPRSAASRGSDARSRSGLVPEREPRDARDGADSFGRVAPRAGAPSRRLPSGR